MSNHDEDWLGKMWKEQQGIQPIHIPPMTTPTPPSAMEEAEQLVSEWCAAGNGATNSVWPSLHPGLTTRIARALSERAKETERALRDVEMFERLAIERASREETLKAQLREREQEVERLREALIKHGGHTWGCEKWATMRRSLSRPCNCGYDEALLPRRPAPDE